MLILLNQIEFEPLMLLSSYQVYFEAGNSLV